MEPIVSIIMGSTSDMKVMENAAALLNEFKIPFEINAPLGTSYSTGSGAICFQGR